MTTSQEEADELLCEWQEWCRRGIAKREKINDGEATIQSIEAGFALFAFLVSSRKEIRARKVTLAANPRPIAREDDDGYDCIELEAMHRAQRTVKHGGSDE